ncbi:MAG: peroxidase-related enzyme [Gemmatimonadota bacterium]
MSWIQVIPEEEAKGDLAEAYRQVVAQRGKVSRIMAIHSLAPKAMAAHLDLYMKIMFEKGGLSRAEREMIAVAVSVENGCRYCTVHHAAALAAWWKDAERVERLRRAPDTAELSPREKRITEYALQLTRAPTEVSEEDVARLREVGLSEAEILQANLVTSYFNFVNRVAEGLGVEPTEEESAGYRY